MLVIPAIDLKDGRCVRLAQGRKEDATIYESDPVDVARRFESAGALMIHVVDLDGAFSSGESPNHAIAREIFSSVKIPVQFGGGMRSIADVKLTIECGAARVVVGTIAVESPETLAKLVKLFGARVCVSIDAREGEVLVRGWERETKVSAIDLARQIARAGIRRIVYTDVARDGMLSGPDIETSCEVARASGLRVTVSGGVSSLEDLRRLRDSGEPLVDSVIVGKALYEGRISLEKALQV